MGLNIALVANRANQVLNFRMGLIKGILEQGHHVIVFAIPDDTVEQIKQSGCEFQALNYDVSSKNPIKDLMFVQQLKKSYHKHNIQVVLGFTIKPNIYGSMAARQMKIPMINNITGLGHVFINQNVLTTIVKRMYKFAFKKSYLVFFQNNDDRQEFLEAGLVKESQCDVLAGSGINTDLYSATKKEKAKTFIFIYIGRIITEKGIRELLEASKIFAQKDNNIKVQLVGSVNTDNPGVITKEDLLQYTKDGVVEWIPFQKDIKPLLSKADCLVLPSYREGTSRVLLEAGALQRPAIATNVPGCNNVIIDGITGLLCKVKDATDLENKMTKMVNLSHEERIMMGQAARKNIEKNFDEKLVVDRYLKEIQIIEEEKNA